MLEGNLDVSIRQAQHIPDPISVGAVGGSGTRLVAEILTAMGVAMATPINEASDALEWPPMRDLLSDPMLAKFTREHILYNAFSGLERLLALRKHNLGLTGRSGWKVPTTHLWIAELAHFFPKLQYVHLLRNGLDMAYSGNQRQAQQWATAQDVVLDRDEAGKVCPGSMLEYWLSSNEAGLNTGAQCLGPRMHVIRFEALCADPEEQIEELARFLGIPVSRDVVQALAGNIHVPASQGRYLQQDWRNDFTADQLQRLGKLGYQP